MATKTYLNPTYIPTYVTVVTLLTVLTVVKKVTVVTVVRKVTVLTVVTVVTNQNFFQQNIFSVKKPFFPPIKISSKTQRGSYSSAQLDQ